MLPGRLAALLLALAVAGCAGSTAPDADAIPEGVLRPLPVAYRPRPPGPVVPHDLGSLFETLEAQTQAQAPTDKQKPGKHPDARGDAAGDAPVSIAQIGDSHSAGDYFSARLRELFQARFGAAGRGMLPPGIPDKYYKPKLVTVSASDGWQRISSRDSAAAAAFGVAGVVQRTTGAGETMTLASDEPEGFDRIAIDYLRQPGGGSLRLSVDGGQKLTISTSGDRTEVARAVFATAPHSRALTLEAVGDAPIELTGWGAWRHGAGVLYQNFGIIGAQADVVLRYDRHALATELADASLLIVAFGSNEAIGPPKDVIDYPARFTAAVLALQAAAPRASIVIVGPPDVNRHAEGAPGQACPNGPALAGSLVVDSRRPAMSGAAPWIRPDQEDTVLAAQREAAAAHGWYFWDWEAAMGGPCAMVRWIDSGLGRADHVHMTIDGYDRSAELLFNTLMDRYDSWREEQRRGVQRSAVEGVRLGAR